MYKTALSEKQANIAKAPDFNEACLPKSAVDSLLMWVMDRITFSDDECKKIHENLLVDPFWEVTPVRVRHSFLLCITLPVKN